MAFPERDTTKELTSALGTMVFVFGIIFLGAIWSSYVMALLWEWFLTPVFAVPVPGLATIFGLVVMFRLASLKPKYNESTENKNKNKYLKFLGAVFGTPLVFLFFGWIAHLFQ